MKTTQIKRCDKKDEDLEHELKRLKKMLDGGVLNPQQYSEQCATAKERFARHAAWRQDLDAALRHVIRG